MSSTTQTQLTLDEVSNKLKKDGYTLHDVQEQTPELCLTAVRQNVPSIQLVPEELRTSELCFVVVQQNRDALQLVSDE